MAEAKPPLPIKIARITLQNGTVNFSDLFVKPNYTVNVTRLGGRVSGLSSAADTVADMDLRGKYANSAPVEILGKLNPLAAKSFLDIKASITGVDLTGFSPYSGKVRRLCHRERQAVAECRLQAGKQPAGGRESPVHRPVYFRRQGG